MSGRIPALVAERILAARRQTYASNEEMEKRRAARGGEISDFMKKMSEMAGVQISIPENQGGLVTKPLVLTDQELCFWSMDDDALDEFLSGDLLPGLFHELSEKQWQRLPAGYRPLVYVLEFERHSQFEGWYAVVNRSDDMPEIIGGYRFLGLHDEAKALAVVAQAHALMRNDDPEAVEDRLGDAYKTVPNTQSDYDARMTALLAFVRSHPELFASAD